MTDTFQSKNMTGAKFTDVNLQNAQFDDVSLSGSTFVNIDLSKAVFSDVNLNHVTILDSCIAGLTINGYDIAALIAAKEKRTSDSIGVKHVSPILLVADMDEALDFYTRVLLFECVRKDPNYSIVRSGHGSIALRQADGDPPSAHAREVYMEVTDIEPLWNHVQQFKGQYKMRDLFDQEYGMPEFHVIAPNDCLVFVGQSARQKSPETNAK